MNVMLDPAISVLLATGGAALFASAAVHKLRSPHVFAATLHEYQLLPQALTAPAAWGLGALEIAIAVALLWPEIRAMGGVAGASLLVVYAFAIAINLARGRRNLDCGCGFRPRTISAWMVARNFVVAALLAMLWLPTSGRLLGFADLATIGAALVVGVLLYASIDLLLGRPAPRDVFSPERS